MPTYTINGKRVTTETQLSDEQIDEIASEIGGTPQSAPQTLPESGAGKVMSEVIGGPVEAGLSMATGMGAAAAGGLAGLLPGTLDERTQRIQSVQQGLTYQPRTSVGQGIVSGLGGAMESVNKGVGRVGGIVGALFGKELEGQMIGEAAIPVAGTLLGAPPMLRGGQAVSRAMEVSRASKAIEAAQQMSQKSAAQMEAAQAGQRLGITLNPAETNPTTGNRLAAAAAGSDLEKNILNKNIGVPEKIAKRDIGLTDDQRLNAENLSSLRSSISPPIDELKAIPSVSMSPEIAAKLQGLKLDDVVASGAKGVNRKIDNLITDMENGVNGDVLWNRIRVLRKEANTGFKSEDPKIVSAAEAKIKIANTLEEMFDDHLKTVGNTELLGQVRDARTKLAKTYAVERVLNNATERIDVNALSKVVKGDNALTGDLADLAKVAANYPDAFTAQPKTMVQTIKDFGGSQVVRSGLPGSIGFGLGAMVGAPAMGGLLGAGAGVIGGKILGKRLVGEGAQKARVVPPQLSSPVSFPPPTTSTAITPYTHQGMFEPSGTGPNWTYGRPTQYPPDVEVRAPQGQPAQLGFTPNAEMIPPRSAPNTSAGIDAILAAQERAAGRAPTGTGQLYDLDPITGRLRPMDQGMKGATPLTVESTGNNLRSATNKISSGQAFRLSSEERIAWNKAKVDLEKAAPELSTLDDAAIAAKVADRQWVQQRVQQLRTEYADWAKQAAENFRKQRTDELNRVANESRLMTSSERSAAKSSNAEAARRLNLMLNRRKQAVQAQIDALESMTDQLSAPRPVYTGSQGPKTREFQRGMMTGATQ